MGEGIKIKTLRNAYNIRKRHFEQFGRLTPEEQIGWALSSGHSLRALMPKEARAWADRLRNGGKKFTHRIRRAVNYS